jgi:hypothetical protein
VFESASFDISNCWGLQRRLFVAFPQDDAVVHTPLPLFTALVVYYSTRDVPGGTVPCLDWLETSKWLDSHPDQQGLRDEFTDVLLDHIPELSCADLEEFEDDNGDLHFQDTADGLLEQDTERVL